MAKATKHKKPIQEDLPVTGKSNAGIFKSSEKGAKPDKGSPAPDPVIPAPRITGYPQAPASFPDGSPRWPNATDETRPIGKGNPPKGWKKGESGNPAGYPKGQPNAKTVIKYWLSAEEDLVNPITNEFQTLTQLDIATLGVIKSARAGNVQAYNSLLDRIEGKPVQSTKLLGPEDGSLIFQIGFTAPGKAVSPAVTENVKKPVKKPAKKQTGKSRGGPGK